MSLTLRMCPWEKNLPPWKECEQESDCVCDMGRRMKPADLVTESNKYFFCCTVLIGDRDQNTFSVLWRDRRQREHVTADDILLDLRDLEITVRVLGGDLRVMKTVKLFQLDLMPVVEKIVVQESTLYELLLFETERKDHRQEKRGLGHSDAVVIAGALAVLLEFFKLIEKTGV